jgi:hypothetical protein
MNKYLPISGYLPSGGVAEKIAIAKQQKQLGLVLLVLNPVQIAVR